MWEQQHRQVSRSRIADLHLHRAHPVPGTSALLSSYVNIQHNCPEQSVFNTITADLLCLHFLQSLWSSVPILLDSLPPTPATALPLQPCKSPALLPCSASAFPFLFFFLSPCPAELHSWISHPAVVFDEHKLALWNRTPKHCGKISPLLDSLVRANLVLLSSSASHHKQSALLFPGLYSHL